MGFSDPGCYGGEIATPNLDALASHGIRYTQFYNTARCWPTRAALLTGYYAQQVNFDVLPDVDSSRSRKRPPWAHLLSEYLRQLGYRNYHSGKWHLDSSPLKCGFDRSYALLDYDHNFSPKNHTLDDQPLPPVQDRRRLLLGRRDRRPRDRVLEAAPARSTPTSRSSRTSHSPFPTFHFKRRPKTSPATRTDTTSAGTRSATIAGNAFNKMLHLPGELSAIEPKTGTPYRSEPARKKLGPVEVWTETPWNELPADKQAFQARKMEIHAAMVTCMDRQIGRVLDQLHAMNADDNTLVLFFSDNGASAEIAMRGDGHDSNAPQGSAATFLSLGPGWSNAANTPFRRHKIWVHEGGIATPLIARWPARNFCGRRTAAHGRPRHRSRADDLEAGRRRMASNSDGTQPIPPHPGHDLVANVCNKTSQSSATSSGGCTKKIGPSARATGSSSPPTTNNGNSTTSPKTALKTTTSRTRYPEKAKELAELWQTRLAEFQQLARTDAPEKPKPKNRAAKKKEANRHPEGALATEGSPRRRVDSSLRSE